MKDFIKTYLSLNDTEKQVFISAFPNSLVAKLDLELKKGALHKKLGISKGKKIPLKDEEKELHSKNKKTRKQAQFAINSRRWKKKKAKKD